MRAHEGWRWAVVGAGLALAAAACGESAGDTGDDTTGGGGQSGGATTADAGGGAAGSGGATPVPTHLVEYEATNAIFRNPERGFYRATSILDEATLSWIDDEYSLYFSYVRLDDYRAQALDDDFLEQIEAGLQKVRAEHAKLILRFAYNFGPYPDAEPDAPLARVLEHIERLAPLLEANQDVIAVVQAGFIGAWGEWHTSTNGLTTAQNKRAIWEALLEAVPQARAVQIRYPRDFWDLFGPEPLSRALAWDASARARTGHHNDCFLAGERDTGTYPAPETPATYKEYLGANQLFVPMGGETCAVDPPRSECSTALAEMEQLRFSYVNDDYHPQVVASWTTGGCRDEMERRLGYRLELSSVRVPQAVAPGAAFSVELRLTNTGFAAPMNPRPARLILASATQSWTASLPRIEVRSWLPGEEQVLRAFVQLPVEIADGDYELHLWLPDSDPGLATDPLYGIRLAHEDLWDAVRGSNRLTQLRVEHSAPTEGGTDAVPFE